MANISIAGRVIKTPEIKFFESGTQVCRISVADRAYVRPEKKGVDSPGQFYDLEVWGKSAEIAADRLSKGSRIAAFGQGVWREYTTKAGETRRAFQVKCGPDGLTYLDTKEESEALRGTTGGVATAGSSSDSDVPF